MPSTTTTRLFEDDAAGGRCLRARRDRFAEHQEFSTSFFCFPVVRLLPLPRPILLVLFFVRSFLPDHEIISLKAHSGEGTTKEKRLPYEAMYTSLLARSPSSPFSLYVLLCRSYQLRSLLPSTYRGARASVSFLSTLRVRAPFSSSSLSVLLPLSLAHAYTHIHTLTYSLSSRDLFVLPASRSVRSLRSFGRHIDAFGHTGDTHRSRSRSSSSTSGRLRVSRRTQEKREMQNMLFRCLSFGTEVPARDGSSYGELTHLSRRGGSRSSFGRASPLLREAKS